MIQTTHKPAQGTIKAIFTGSRKEEGSAKRGSEKVTRGKNSDRGGNFEGAYRLKSARTVGRGRTEAFPDEMAHGAGNGKSSTSSGGILSGLGDLPRV